MRAAIPLALCVVLAHLAGRYLWFESSVFCLNAAGTG